MYTIKQAAARTGLGAPLIRAWERRYGVIEPARSSSGYRLYDEATIRVLMAMRTLVDGGWSASEAARAITAGEISIDEVAMTAPTRREPAASTAATRRAQVIERFVAAAESASPAETEAVLDEILASGSFEATVDDLLLPAAAALGAAWEAGRLSVAGEHAASAAVARRLAAAYQAAASAGRVAVLVGLPPGSRHELGAMAFAVALRRLGVGVLYLGPDVPADAWIDIVRRIRPRAAVVGIVTAADREPAALVVDALGREGVQIVAIGGAAATRNPSMPDQVLVLPDRVVEAAGALARALNRRGGRPGPRGERPAGHTASTAGDPS